MMLLTTPYQHDRIRLSNRIVLPPMVIWAAEENGMVNDYVLGHYGSFRDLGYAIVEATVVSPEGRLSQRQIGAFDDAHLPGLRRLAETLHSRADLVGIQLHHAGRNTTTHNTFGRPLLAPSAITSAQGELPVELTLGEIERIQNDFVSAALRVAEAGFDAIELHGAHSYLISQFLSPLTNQRNDHYGGSLENRARFGLEVVRKVRQAVGERCIITMRLGIADGMEGGLTVDEGQQVAQWIVEAGVEMLHISSGVGAPPTSVRPEGSPWTERLHLARLAKQAVHVPVIGVGGIVTPQQAEQALQEEMADLVAVGKGLLADPLWASKALGQVTDPLCTCMKCRVCGHYRHPFTCPARALAARAQ
ncbi:MAG: tRNA-dihydrouridine synthase [Bacillota bacterium]